MEDVPLEFPVYFTLRQYVLPKKDGHGREQESADFSKSAFF
jgi:hypothetical protein